MLDASMFPLERLTAIEQGGLRALCFPKPIGDGVVANHWFLRRLVLPPTAPIAFVDSPVQVSDPTADPATILTEAWLALQLPTDDVEAWQVNASVFTQMPSAEPTDYPISIPPLQGFLRAGSGGPRIEEMDGGEVFGWSPQQGNQTVAHAFRDDGSFGTPDQWVEYWGLLASYRAPRGVGTVVVEEQAPAHASLTAFLAFLQPKVNAEGARLVVSGAKSYGPVSLPPACVST